MATDQTYICQCGKKPVDDVLLFDALLNIANSRKPVCNTCDATKELDLTFHFRLGGGEPQCRVLAVYSPIGPTSAWTEAGETITFHPFLVILEDSDEGRKFWLPYWHTAERGGNTRRMYGQFAPFLSVDTFKNLLVQAHRDGYLTDLAASHFPVVAGV
jgi:hypothetical protein